MSNDKIIYNLQQIKKYLIEEKDNKYNNETYGRRILKNMFCIFGNDNSFLFVLQGKCTVLLYNFSPISIIEYIINFIFCNPRLLETNYYLKDFFTGSVITEYYDEKFLDGNIYTVNNIDYYVINISKIIPATYLNNKVDFVYIQDRINEFLSKNPEFINQVFFKEQEEKNKDKKLVKDK